MAIRNAILSTFASGVAAFTLNYSNPAKAKVEGDTIVLGSAISFTGKYSTGGIHAKNGYTMAVDFINERGGIKVGGKTYKFKILYFDDESSPGHTALLVEKLIKENGIQYLLGPFSTTMSAAAAPVTEKYKIPMIMAGSASRSLFSEGYSYIFTVLSTAEQYFRSSVALAAKIGKKNGKKPTDVTVAMAFEDDVFSQDVRVSVKEDIKRHGLTIVIDENLPRDLSDMTSTLTKVKSLKPDVLLVSGHSKGATTAARQIKEMKIKTPLVAISHCESSKMINKFGGAVEGILCPTQWVETLATTGKYFGSADFFEKVFKDKFQGYNKGVPYQAAQAAAAVLVWKDAFERAQSFDTEKLRVAISETDIETFYGNIKFSKAGSNIAKGMFLRQIQEGVLYVVVPENLAVKSVVYPRKPN